jgi:5'-nucleotidase
MDHLQKRTTLLTAILLLAALLPATVPSIAEELTVLIMHTNDFHGHLVPVREANEKYPYGRPIGGGAALAEAVQKHRTEALQNGWQFLLLDAGDIFEGTPEGYALYNDARGGAVIEFMNRLGYDAACLGNHEFAFGIANLKKLAKAAKFTSTPPHGLPAPYPNSKTRSSPAYIRF